MEDVIINSTFKWLNRSRRWLSCRRREK